MSYFKQTKLRLRNLLAGRVYKAAVIEAPNGSRTVPPGRAAPAVATLTQMEVGSSHYDSTASYHSTLSEEEVLLLQEKEALTKVVEQLSLRRQAVAAARRKTEEEVRRLAQEESARRHATEEALRNSETERRRLHEEEKALRQVTDNLIRRRAEGEATREPATVEATRPDERQASTRLHERLRELAQRERQKIEEPGSCAGDEKLRIAEPQPMRNKAADAAPEQLTLEQRLRAEIDGLAAAQKKSIDAARAQINVLRNTERSHAPSAA